MFSSAGSVEPNPRAARGAGRARIGSASSRREHAANEVLWLEGLSRAVILSLRAPRRPSASQRAEMIPTLIAALSLVSCSPEQPPIDCDDLTPSFLAVGGERLDIFPYSMTDAFVSCGSQAHDFALEMLSTCLTGEDKPELSDDQVVDLLFILTFSRASDAPLSRLEREFVLPYLTHPSREVRWAAAQMLDEGACRDCGVEATSALAMGAPFLDRYDPFVTLAVADLRVDCLPFLIGLKGSLSPELWHSRAMLAPYSLHDILSLCLKSRELQANLPPANEG